MNLSESRYATVDTMFSLPEVYLYAELVHFFENALGTWMIGLCMYLTAAQLLILA